MGCQISRVLHLPSGLGAKKKASLGSNERAIKRSGSSMDDLKQRKPAKSSVALDANMIAEQRARKETPLLELEAAKSIHISGASALPDISEGLKVKKVDLARKLSDSGVPLPEVGKNAALQRRKLSRYATVDEAGLLRAKNVLSGGNPKKAKSLMKRYSTTSLFTSTPAEKPARKPAAIAKMQTAKGTKNRINVPIASTKASVAIFSKNPSRQNEPLKIDLNLNLNFGGGENVQVRRRLFQRHSSSPAGMPELSETRQGEDNNTNFSIRDTIDENTTECSNSTLQHRDFTGNQSSIWGQSPLNLALANDFFTAAEDSRNERISEIFLSAQGALERTRSAVSQRLCAEILNQLKQYSGVDASECPDAALVLDPNVDHNGPGFISTGINLLQIGQAESGLLSTLISDNVCLSQLCVRNVQLTNFAAINILTSLKTNSNLEVLEFSRAGMTDLHASKLAHALETCCNLKVLNFSNNYLTRWGCLALLRVLLCENVELRSVFLQGNDFPTTEIENLAKCILPAYCTLEQLVLRDGEDEGDDDSCAEEGIKEQIHTGLKRLARVLDTLSFVDENTPFGTLLRTQLNEHYVNDIAPLVKIASPDRFCNSEAKNVCPAIGAASIVGRRAQNQDSILVAPGIGGVQNHVLMGVFDGHGGLEVSRLVRANFVSIFENNLKEQQASEVLTDVMVEVAFKNTFNALQDCVARMGLPGGSCALAVFVTGDKVYTANAGDSEAMLFSLSKRQVELLRDPESLQRMSKRNTFTRFWTDKAQGSGSTDTASSRAKRRIGWNKDKVFSIAKTARPNDDNEFLEIERIRKAGGFVIRGRVDGALAVSRSIGDLKHTPKVTHEPYFSCHTLDDRENSLHFIVMGSDGLWDVFKENEKDAMFDVFLKEVFKDDSSEDLPVRALVQKNSWRAASTLCAEALEEGSTDNICVVTACI